jgi:hypothetical protein
MALFSAALEVSTHPATAPNTAAVVAPTDDCGYATALVRQGWQPVAVHPVPRLRASARTARARGPYAHTVEHRGSLRQTVKALRGLNVSVVLAGSAAGIALAERIAWQLGVQGSDPAAALLRQDHGMQAAALARAGIPALRSVRTTSLAEALRWAEEHPLPGYVLAPAAAGVPVEATACWHDFQISAAWPAMRRAAAQHAGDHHLVLSERPPGRQYVVNTLTRPGLDGTPEHTVTDLWVQTHEPGGVLARTDLLNRHELLTRALAMYTLRVLDTLGVVCGSVTSRVAFGEGRAPVLVSALAVPGTSLADDALIKATGHDRFTDALDAVIAPAPGQLIPAPTGHHVVRVHLHPRSGGTDPHLGRILRQLPTVVAVSKDLQPEPSATATTVGAEVVLSSDEPQAVEADYRVIRALEREGLYPEDRP